MFMVSINSPSNKIMIVQFMGLLISTTLSGLISHSICSEEYNKIRQSEHNAETNRVNESKQIISKYQKTNHDPAMNEIIKKWRYNN